MAKRLAPAEKARRQAARDLAKLERSYRKKKLPLPRRGPEAYKRRKLRELSRSGQTPYQRQKVVSEIRYGAATPKKATPLIAFQKMRHAYLKITGQEVGSDLDYWINRHPVAARAALTKCEDQAAFRASGIHISRSNWELEWEDEEFADMPPEGTYYHGGEVF